MQTPHMYNAGYFLFKKCNLDAKRKIAMIFQKREKPLLLLNQKTLPVGGVSFISISDNKPWVQARKVLFILGNHFLF